MKNLTKPNIVTPERKPRRAAAPRRRERFVREYLIDLNGRAAAVRAGYSGVTARSIASELLALPEIQAKVKKEMQARSERTGITADKVLERWWAVATADPNELIELRRVCCRYCYGKGHRYQWTPRELAEALAQFERDKMFAEAKGVTFSATFDAAGGVGYDQRQDPTSACPECHGQGIEITYPKDTRDLSPEGKLLYAGVKKTHDGLEIKMHSQDAALVNVAKHLGMLGQRIKHSNDPDNPIPSACVVMIPAKALPDDPGT